LQVAWYWEACVLEENVLPQLRNKFDYLAE